MSQLARHRIRSGITRGFSEPLPGSPQLGGDDDLAGFADFGANGRIKIEQPDLASIPERPRHLKR
jgi:hypothetical protein